MLMYIFYTLVSLTGPTNDSLTDCNNEQCKYEIIQRFNNLMPSIAPEETMDFQFELFTFYLANENSSNQLKTLVEATLVLNWEFNRARWASLNYYERLRNFASTWWGRVTNIEGANRFMFMLELSTIGKLQLNDTMHKKYIERFKGFIGRGDSIKSNVIIGLGVVVVIIQDVDKLRELYYLSGGVMEIGNVSSIDSSFTASVNNLKIMIIEGIKDRILFKRVLKRVGCMLDDKTTYIINE